jgi:hypothetical protein
LSRGPSPEPSGVPSVSEPVPELELYLQAVFTLFDVLSRWLRDAWAAGATRGPAATGGGGSGGGRTTSGGSGARGGSGGRTSGGGGSGGGASPELQQLSAAAQKVAAFIASIPKNLMAQAALG